MFFKLAFISLIAALVLGIHSAPSTRDAPFIETFHRDGKILIYVLALHHSSLLFPDPMTDPVFKTIQSVFSKTPPDAVIIEGVDPSQMLGFLDYSKQCAAAKYNLPGGGCEESSFTAYSATQNRVPVYTGEPSTRVSLSVFEARGYSIQDFLAFWIMNNIPPAKRHEQLTEDNFPQLVDRIVGQDNHLLGTSTRFSKQDFAAWYAKNMHIPRSYLDITQEDTNPYPPPQEPKTLFHTLNALNAKGRDGNIVNMIETVLQNHNRVLVVYGASHLDFEWKELVQLMGVPKKTKPF